MATSNKTGFPLFGYEQELRQTILRTFEDFVKCCLLVQYNTTQEREDQQSLIADKSIAELVVPKLEQL